MAHSEAIRSGRVGAQVHPRLDPKLPNHAGVVIRESRDSDEHPNSTPIAVIFDTTGGMGTVPEQLVAKLGTLMQLLTEKNYIPDPQVLFGAVNDASTRASVPLEIGQFESGNQMDDVITSIYASQGGETVGITESYELAFYFLARKTVLDSLEKRGKKGYLFVIGDEIPYPTVSQREVRDIIGDELEADIPLADILEELKRKFEVFWIMPEGYGNWRNQSVKTKLTELFGQRYLTIPHPDIICEFIAATIAVNEGRDPRVVQAELIAAGVNGDAASAAAAAAARALPPDRELNLGEL